MAACEVYFDDSFFILLHDTCFDSIYILYVQHMGYINLSIIADSLTI